ncbi:MAG: transposase [Promethearchaeota archaeon]
MTEVGLGGSTTDYTMVDLLQDEVSKVKKRLPKNYDGVAKFLAIMRPVIELTMMNCGDWTDQFEPTGKGRPRVSHTTLMLIMILAKMQKVSYRQIERMINSHPNWLHALKVEKCPSHARLSTFRKEKGAPFFKNFFDKLLELMDRYELVKGEALIVDSAPIKASMNFARANSTPKINTELVKEFFNEIDVSPATSRLNCGTTNRKYSPASLIRFFMFEKLGNFLSTSQALKFVENHPNIGKILGFPWKRVPNQSTFTYFKNQYGDVPELLLPLVDDVIEFLESSETAPEGSEENFFLWDL